jgi:serine phosphatase RsbU (regulator of sigma subunit)
MAAISASEGRPPTVPGRRYSAWEWVRTIAISAGVGVGITLVIGLGSPQVVGAAALIGGALIGACIGLGASSLDFYVVRPLERFAWLPIRPVRMVGFFVGGVAGWLGGSYLAESVLGFQPWPSVGYGPMVVFGGVSVVVGLLFEGYGRLRARLEQSVAELKEREFAEKELETARAIQRRLLPPDTSLGDGYRLAAINLPARVVAGDFYDFFRLPDGTLGVAVADVSGKGMGASLIMASTKAMLQLVAAERTAAEALEELNRKLHADLASREFVALLLLRFDPASGQVELANAGLPDPYVLAVGREPVPIEVPGPRLPLGVRAAVGYRSLRFVLDPGQRLLLFTDGLAEAPDEHDEPFGYERLTAALARPGVTVPVDDAAGLRRWLDSVVATVTSPGSRPLEDDCTALVLERLRSAIPSARPQVLAAR